MRIPSLRGDATPPSPATLRTEVHTKSTISRLVQLCGNFDPEPQKLTGGRRSEEAPPFPSPHGIEFRDADKSVLNLRTQQTPKPNPPRRSSRARSSLWGDADPSTNCDATKSSAHIVDYYSYGLIMRQFRPQTPNTSAGCRSEEAPIISQWVAGSSMST